MAKGLRRAEWDRLAWLCHVVANSGFGWSAKFHPPQFNAYDRQAETVARYGPKESMRILDAVAAGSA
jgi:hypothetical protein